MSAVIFEIMSPIKGEFRVWHFKTIGQGSGWYKPDFSLRPDPILSWHINCRVMFHNSGIRLGLLGRSDPWARFQVHLLTRTLGEVRSLTCALGEAHLLMCTLGVAHLKFLESKLPPWLRVPFRGFILICRSGCRFCKTGCNTLVSGNIIAGRYST